MELTLAVLSSASTVSCCLLPRVSTFDINMIQIRDIPARTFELTSPLPCITDPFREDVLIVPSPGLRFRLGNRGSPQTRDCRAKNTTSHLDAAMNPLIGHWIYTPTSQR
jgi:hypothetical protein